jgi:drug/metabolite transporter (DMT)-like permease
VPLWWRGVPVIALASVFFAAMAVAARSLAPVLSPGQLVLARFVVGLAVTGVWFAARRTPPRAGRPLLWAMRGVLGGGAVYFYFLSIERLGVGPATVLNYTSPVWAAAFGAWFLRERVGGHTLLGVAVATVGAGLVVGSTLESGPGAPALLLGAGAWAGVVSALLGGGAQTVIRALRRDTDAASIFFSFCLFGLLWALPFAVADWRPVPASAWGPVLLMGLLSAVAQVLFTYAFAYTTAAVGSATTQLTPALSWVLGVLVLDEHMAPLALGGAALCAAGVLWGTARHVHGEARRAAAAASEAAAPVAAAPGHAAAPAHAGTLPASVPAAHAGALLGGPARHTAAGAAGAVDAAHAAGAVDAAHAAGAVDAAHAAGAVDAQVTAGASADGPRVR